MHWMTMQQQQYVGNRPNVERVGQLHSRDAMLLVTKDIRLTLEATHPNLLSWLIRLLMFDVCCDRETLFSSVIETH